MEVKKLINRRVGSSSETLPISQEPGALTLDELLAMKRSTEENVKSCDGEIEEINVRTKVEGDKLEDVMTELRNNLNILRHGAGDKIETIEDDKLSMEKLLGAERSVFLRRIALSSLKKVMPDEFKRENFGGHDEDKRSGTVLHQTPILSIIALSGETDKPVNKYSYRIGICAYNRFSRTILNLSGFMDEYNLEATLIFNKDFKTLEDRDAYATKHNERIITEPRAKIDAFVGEVRNASDDFNEVFDFRLIFSEELSRNYSGDYTYTIRDRKKHSLKCHHGYREENISLTIKQKDYTFEIQGGGVIDELQVFGALFKEFKLAHIEKEYWKKHEEQEKRKQIASQEA